ncbi:MAG TPA: hypothetical protein VJ890_26250 [Vineibacter sp.]|nr:hypothetical protein [Vineibacter sp.]
MSRFGQMLRGLFARAKTMTDDPPHEPLPTAYAFRTDDPTFEALLHRLNELGPWQWIERDSHWYGDYMSTMPEPHKVMLKIFKERDGFVIQFGNRYRGVADADPEDYRALRETIFSRLLPSIGARDIRPDEGFD